MWRLLGLVSSMLLSHQSVFSSARSSGAADLGPHLTWEPTHPSLSGVDLGWSEGLLDFVFANNRWVTSAPEGPPVPGYHPVPPNVLVTAADKQ